MGRITNKQVMEKLESLQNNTFNKEISDKFNDLQATINELNKEGIRSVILAYMSVAFAFFSIAISVIPKFVTLEPVHYGMIFICYFIAGIYVLIEVFRSIGKYEKSFKEKH